MQNSDKFWNIIDNADSFTVRTGSDKIEFGWAKQVNLAFAIELYLKAIMEIEKQEIKRGHKLNILFNELDNKTQSAIYNIWRTLAGANIPDNERIRAWFKDNLFANGNTFEKFRYVHEWAGSRVCLETSWDIEQFRKFSIFSAEHEFGKLLVYDSFLKEFQRAIKEYIKDNVIPNVPSRSYDLMMATEISCTIERPDGSIKTEKQKIVMPMNVTSVDK